VETVSKVQSIIHATPPQTAQRAPSGEHEGYDALWTAKDVADYLRASISWVYQKSEGGLLPCLPRLPGSNFLRFDPVAVRAYARGEWRPETVVPMRTRRSRTNR
jgi:hypothetical protein